MNSFVKLLFTASLVLLLGCNKNIAPRLTSENQDSITTKTITTDHPVGHTPFQQKLNADYADPEKSPLSEEQRRLFIAARGHSFYPLNESYRIVAELDTTALAENIQFETTTDRIAVYDLYGIARFEWMGEEVALNIYQSHRLRVMEEYKDHLFLPFTDLTNGSETYGGGRYVDLKLPEGNEIIIDFNMAYSPYCAYSDKYSCPIPPVDNALNFEVKAGVRNLVVIMKK